MKEDKKSSFIGPLLLLLAVLLVAGLIVADIINKKYKKGFERILKEQIALKLEEGDYPVEETDLFGNELQYHKDIEDYGILHQLRTRGSDGEFNTNDDHVLSDIDMNKSRMIGHFVGQKSKEALKGIWDGLKKKSEFDKDKK